MVYPIIPLSNRWGQSQRSEAEPFEIKTSESGLVSRANKDFINQNRKTWSVKVALDYTEQQTVEAFLRERRGRPFAYFPKDTDISDLSVYICNNWTWDLIHYAAVGASSSAVWELSAEFKQVFRMEGGDFSEIPEGLTAELIPVLFHHHRLGA